MLQIHLPLNKQNNFYNQGLADVTVTNNGATYNTNGKIGGCYTFGDGTSSNQSKGISINTNFSQIGESRSICAWVRPKGNHLHYSGAIVSSGDWNGSYCWGFCLKQDNTGFTGFDLNYRNYYNTDIPINSWTHLCVTVQNGVTKFYKNGQYLGEQSRGSGSLSSDAANTMIGRETYAGGYFSFNGDISDVRIYSHSLSPKEVHEIAKGLVLHYPMNNIIGKNLISNTNWDTDKKFILQSGTEGGFRYTPNTQLQIDTTYTLSCKIRGNANMSLYTINTGGNVSFFFINRSNLSLTEYKLFSKSFKVTGSKTINQIYICTTYGSSNSQVGDWFEIQAGSLKLELGNVTTPWCLDNETTVYDCSGYCNNGTIISSLQIVDDSPRYKKSIYSDGNQKITSPIGLDIPSNNLTVSCWVKRPEVIDSNTMRCFLNPGYTNNNRFYFRILPQGNTAIFNVGFGANIYGTKTIDANWHHLAVTTESDGKTINIYVDGIKTNIGIEQNTFTIARNFILLDYFIGKISDFRFYRTTLSDDDIKELYNTSAIINNNNTLEAYEFSETDTYSINKSGVLEGAEFIEQDGEVQINNTEQVFATEFTEI